jgi:hypothetical protein
MMHQAPELPLAQQRARIVPLELSSKKLAGADRDRSGSF